MNRAPLLPGYDGEWYISGISDSTGRCTWCKYRPTSSSFRDPIMRGYRRGFLVAVWHLVIKYIRIYPHNLSVIRFSKAYDFLDKISPSCRTGYKLWKGKWHVNIYFCSSPVTNTGEHFMDPSAIIVDLPRCIQLYRPIEHYTITGSGWIRYLGYKQLLCARLRNTGWNSLP